MSLWIERLRRACEESSQAKVARDLRQRDGFPSSTVINQVVHGTYPSEKGRARLRELVEGRYMGVTVECPIQGQIARDECAHWQQQPFTTANPERVSMFRACRTCPNRRSD